jgi:hypothetical protein
MLLPLDDALIARGASPETAFDQQMVELDQRRYRHSRRADNRHAGAGEGIQHPCRNRRDHARHRLDMNDQAGDTLFAIMTSKPAPMERMPAVVDLNFLTDMGRMSGRLLSIAKMRCSPAATMGRKTGQCWPR